MLASLDQSLERLGIDYVDIFYSHRMDPDTPLEETMSALATAVNAGKALYAGLSRYDAETMKKAEAILRRLNVPYVINQDRFSLFDRTIEHNGVMEASMELGKGMIIFSPLAQGLLSDRYLNGIPENSRIRTDGRFLKENSLTEETLNRIRLLSDLAASRSQTLAQMALAYVLSKPAVTTVLIGASRPSQILDNIKAVENTVFSSRELSRIGEITGIAG